MSEAARGPSESPTLAPPRPLWRRLITAPFVLLIALVLVLEEWLWDPLKRAMRWVAQLPGIRYLERKIAALPPYGALAVFALPGLVLLPFKLVGLALIASGRGGLGVLVFVAAKIVGTALLAHLLELTGPTLRTLPWFARLQDGLVRFKKRIYALVWENPMVRALRAAARRLRDRVRALLSGAA